MEIFYNQGYLLALMYSLMNKFRYDQATKSKNDKKEKNKNRNKTNYNRPSGPPSNNVTIYISKYFVLQLFVYFILQTKNIYINLIEHLRTSDLLPMVVFIFSRNRCDETAQILKSVDLTTEKEKWKIRQFFEKCIDRLKGSDKELPQVLNILGP